jgi:hypothetical protein
MERAEHVCSAWAVQTSTCSCGKGIIDLDAEVTGSALHLYMSKQELHGSQITRCAGRSGLPLSVVATNTEKMWVWADTEYI